MIRLAIGDARRMDRDATSETNAAAGVARANNCLFATCHDVSAMQDHAAQAEIEWHADDDRPQDDERRVLRPLHLLRCAPPSRWLHDRPLRIVRSGCFRHQHEPSRTTKGYCAGSTQGCITEILVPKSA